MSSSPHVVPCQRCGGYKEVVWTRRGRSKLTLLMAVLIFTLVMAFRLHRCISHTSQKESEGTARTLDRWTPLIFIGGVPRSGSSLVRVLLDSHPQIRCVPDTSVIPSMLQLYHYWITNVKESNRLLEAGVTPQVLESAVAALFLGVLEHQGLCYKNSLSLVYAHYLALMFPNSKFLWVVRDPRATVHSIISRQIHVSKFNLESYWESLDQWNNSTREMLEQCQLIGKKRCRLVHYEQLVLRPQQVLKRVLDFLDLPWHDSVLQHHRLVNKPGGVTLSRFDISSAEVRQPIYKDSLSRWFGRLPEDVLKDLPRLTPLMTLLGYDPSDPQPNYLNLQSELAL